MKEIIDKIKKGGVGVLPTDTLYGLCCSVFHKDSIERIYEIKKRNPKKPVLVLIGSKRDLKIFGAKVPKKLKRFWPGKVSIILPCSSFPYIHRGGNSIGFRLPKLKWLRKLLKKTGPLVAPTCNPEGKEPAKTISQAKNYFPSLDFYLDKGKLGGKPSTLIKLEKGEIIVLRKGAVKIC